MDISRLLKQSGINVERTATDIFGVAVEDFARGKLNPAISRALGGNGTQPINRNDGTWHATSYAAGAANSTARPKLKFLFKVQFLFKPNIANAEVKRLVDLLQKDQDFTYMVKSVDRPKVDYDYEDVNMYNFRTKVLKQIKHRELTLTFIDDVGNHVFNFFKLLMMAHSPITRQSANNYKSLAEVVAAYSTGSGMAFGVGNDLANRGVIDSDIGNVIQAIRILQIFPDHTETLDNAVKAVAWDFVNPRIVSFDLEDMSHESSDPNGLTMQFDYDFMVMNDLGSLTSVPAPDYSNKTWKGAPGDISPTGQGTGQSAQGGNNPISNILSSIGGRAAQKLTSEVLGRQLRKVPGLGGTADLIGGIVGSRATSGLSGLMNNIGQSFARPSRPTVTEGGFPGVSGFTNSTSQGFGFGQPSPFNIDLGGGD